MRRSGLRNLPGLRSWRLRRSSPANRLLRWAVSSSPSILDDWPQRRRGYVALGRGVHRRRIIAPLAVMWPGTLGGHRHRPWSPPPNGPTSAGTIRPHSTIVMRTPAAHEAAWTPDTDDIGQQTISQPQSETTGAR